MWTGWNQPPEVLVRSQISTAPSSGSAMQCVYPLLMTSPRVSPLIVHRLLLRMNQNSLFSTPCASSCDSVQLMHSGVATFSDQSAGILFPASVVTVVPTLNCMTCLIES